MTSCDTHGLTLVHGWGMHAEIFAPLIASLEGRWAVRALDLPGHGARPRGELMDDLDVLADQMVAQSPPSIWLGWSLGGLVAARAAMRHPDQVQALVLVAATPRFVASPDWPEGMPRSVFHGFAEDLETDYRATLDRFVALEVHGSDTARRDLPHLRKVLHRYPEPERRTLRSGLQLLETVDLRPDLERIGQPVLLIGGRRDRLVGAAAVERYARLLPRAEMTMMAGSGHAPFIGHPNQFRQHLVKFLEEQFES